MVSTVGTPSNPFATRFFTAGAIEYQFTEDFSTRELIDRLMGHHPRRGAIIGPHGSGKSTLVACIRRQIEATMRFDRCHHLQVNAAGKANLQFLSTIPRIPASGFFSLDGFEQLNALSRILLRCVSSQRRTVVLVTAHAPLAGYPTLWQTTTDARTEYYVISKLLQPYPEAIDCLLKSPQWQHSRSKHGSNLRESLFDMYDWWRDELPKQEPQDR
jgi:hypothetical protein